MQFLKYHLSLKNSIADFRGRPPVFPQRKVRLDIPASMKKLKNNQGWFPESLTDHTRKEGGSFLVTLQDCYNKLETSQVFSAPGLHLQYGDTTIL